MLYSAVFFLGLSCNSFVYLFI